MREIQIGVRKFKNVVDIICSWFHSNTRISGSSLDKTAASRYTIITVVKFHLKTISPRFPAVAFAFTWK